MAETIEKNDKSLDYFGTLKKAFDITKSHKYLWFLGILAGGASSFNSGGGGSSPTSDNSTENAQHVFQNMGTWIQQNIALIVVLGFIMFLLIAVFTVISLMARGGLVDAVDKEDKGEESSFTKAMGFGWHKAWRLFGMGWIYFLIFMAVILPFVVVFVLLGILQLWIPFVILLIPVILGFIFFAIIVGIVGEYALRFATIGDVKAWQSIKSGYRLLMARKKESSLVFLVLMLVGLVGGLAMLAAIFIVAIPLVIIGIILALISKIALVIYIVLAAVIMLVTILLAAGFLSSLSSAYWTLSFKELASLDGQTGGAQEAVV